MVSFICFVCLGDRLVGWFLVNSLITSCDFFSSIAIYALCELNVNMHMYRIVGTASGNDECRIIGISCLCYQHVLK